MWNSGQGDLGGLPKSEQRHPQGIEGRLPGTLVAQAQGLQYP